MALQKDIEKFGITFENGYHKITAVNWFMFDNIAHVVIESFKDEAAAEFPTNSLETRSYNFEDFIEPKGSEKNAIQAAYEKIKELEEWSEATDV